MGLKELTVTVRLTLDEEEQNRLAELVDLKRKFDIVRYGRLHSEVSYAEDWLLALAFSRAMFNGLLDDELAFRKRLLHYCEAKHASDEAEPEPKNVSNGEEEASVRTDEEPETPSQLVKDRTDEYFNYLEHGTMPEDSHETLIPVIDADGVHRMATFDEVEEMREAAQGIYNGAPPEPKEPEDSFRDKGCLYDPALYEDDACECGSIVVSDPESLAFADALFEALYRR